MKRNPSAYGKRCGAKTRGGSPCKNAAMPNGRCRMHGGRSLRGVSHPRFSHGRYSRDVIAGLTSRYREALTDRKRFDLTEDIALLDTHLAQTLQEGESLQGWKDARDAWKAVDDALLGGDARMLKRAHRELGDILKGGLFDYAHRAEVRTALESRKRLVEAEHKHRIDKRFALTYEEAMTQIAEMVDIIRKRVKDRDLLRAITDDIDRIVRGTKGGSQRDADRN